MNRFLNRVALCGFALLVSFESMANVINYEQVVDRSITLLQKLIEAKPISGCEDEAAVEIQKRLRQLNLPFIVVESGDEPKSPPAKVSDPGALCLDGRQPSSHRRPNIIVNLAADKPKQKLKSVMIVAHMDVVPALKQVWSPGIQAHQLTRKDGYLYGRGSFDMLSYTALMVEFFGELKRQNISLERDLVLMLNSDEERGGFNGIGWLVKNKPELFSRVEFALSEGGAIVADDEQKPLFIGYEAGQKRYQDFKITAVGPTGHSSTPTKIQAVDLLNEAVLNVKKMQAPARLIPLIRGYFQERAKVESDATLRAILARVGGASDNDAQNLTKSFPKEIKILEEQYPVVFALLRRSCTTTVLEAGGATAKNAQPQTATAYVNCRLMPDESVDNLLPQLQQVVNKSFGTTPESPSVSIAMDVDFRSSHAGASDIEGLIPQLFKKYAQSYFKGIPVVPSMLAGATDLRFLRKLGIQAYGLAPILVSDNDKRRAHGIDERIFEDNLKYGLEMYANVVFDVVAPSSRQPASVVSQYPHQPSKNFKHAFDGEGCRHH
jgi:acetylornithine deacetylase/succinyl-diaminopimelate desuccinylase-like protein